ncbi:MAG: hypothetical protein U0075_14555 [Thermomicrobiales bacterium]
MITLGAADLSLQRWSRWMFPLAAGALLVAAALLLGVVGYYWGKPQTSDYLFECSSARCWLYSLPGGEDSDSV